MRIAQLIDSLTVGGAEKLQVVFARAVRDLDTDLTVVSLHRKPYQEIDRALERLGARVMTFEGSGLLDPRRGNRLVRFLKRERFEVVFTHLTAANILGSVAARLAGTPSISTLHNVEATRSRFNRALETWVLRRLPRRVVAVGGAVAEAHRQRLGDRECVVVSNPVSPISPLSAEERQTVRRDLVGAGHDFIFMSTGMLTVQKALPDLLEAFAELRTTHPGSALVIAGAGPLEDELEASIDRLGLRGHARLLGLRHDIPRLLAAVDGYVSSSHWEGLPLSVLEAMAAGLPVVATAVGDLEAVVVRGTGRLVPPRRPDGLALAMRSVLEDRSSAREMGAAARRHVVRNYSPVAWAERLLALGAEVLREIRR